MKHITVLLGVCLVFAVSCGSPAGSNPADNSTGYTVTFNSNGGSKIAAVVTLGEGDLITKPKNPAKAGFVFVGWYKDAKLNGSGGAGKWNFSLETIVDMNTTLYARWVPYPFILDNDDVPGSVADVGEYLKEAEYSGTPIPVQLCYSQYNDPYDVDYDFWAHLLGDGVLAQKKPIHLDLSGCSGFNASDITVISRFSLLSHGGYIETATLPSNVNSIVNETFKYCTILKTVDIREASEIWNSAFLETGSGDLIIYLGGGAPTLRFDVVSPTNIFEGVTSKQVTVRVPNGATGYDTTWKDNFKGSSGITLSVVQGNW